MSDDDPKPPRRPNVATCLAAIEEALLCALTAQRTGEVDPVAVVRLESLIGYWRDHRAILIDLLEEP